MWRHKSWQRKQQRGNATRSLLQRIPQITNPQVCGSIAASGLTGQGMTDQFNLMNAPLMEEEEEDFYVPVRLNDRGVRRRPRNLSGTGGSITSLTPFHTPLRRL